MRKRLKYNEKHRQKVIYLHQKGWIDTEISKHTGIGIWYVNKTTTAYLDEQRELMNV